ncbi:MAG: transposase, partial [bacterium]
MSHMSFGDAEHAGKRKKTRRELFLEEMEQIIPWKALIREIDPEMEEALYEWASMRKFSGLSLLEAIPDETTILNFRRLIER